MTNEKLTEIDLMCGDILAYHEIFKKSENNNITTYKQRAAELKSRLKRSHIIRMGSNKKPIKVQETIKDTRILHTRILGKNHCISIFIIQINMDILNSKSF